MTNLTENLWLLRYPLKMLGADLHRNVTVMRLRSGDLVIHSTGPFALEDVAHVNSLGRPRWLLDVMLRHDTFAKQGKEAFPEAAYLGPDGFSEVVKFRSARCSRLRRSGGTRWKSSGWTGFRAWRNTRCSTALRAR